MNLGKKKVAIKRQVGNPLGICKKNEKRPQKSLRGLNVSLKRSERRAGELWGQEKPAESFRKKKK